LPLANEELAELDRQTYYSNKIKNMSWNPNSIAKCIPFREDSELQACPSMFQHTHTQVHTI
jgi:hypothetical protein